MMMIIYIQAVIQYIELQETNCSHLEVFSHWQNTINFTKASYFFYCEQPLSTLIITVALQMQLIKHMVIA